MHNVLKPVFLIAAGLTLFPFVSSSGALLLGILVALIFGNPWLEKTKSSTSILLQISIVGLGAGMNLNVIGHTGAHYFVYTVIGIVLTLALGLVLGRFIGIPQKVSILIATGTAICGGSAIAAVAPTIRAKSHEISISLATVFILNAVALLVFPWVGHQVGLNEVQFGLWSALAIHDTSSVVGAALQYGPKALEVATTVKLARALWIIPLTLIIAVIWNQRNPNTNLTQKTKKPWFILGFIIASACVTWIPILQPTGNLIAMAAKRLLVLTLYLIGSSLTWETLKEVGIKPFIQATLLWIFVATGTIGIIAANFP